MNYDNYHFDAGHGYELRTWPGDPDRTYIEVRTGGGRPLLGHIPTKDIPALVAHTETVLAREARRAANELPVPGLLAQSLWLMLTSPVCIGAMIGALLFHGGGC